jgi:hypothetical protein
MKNRAIGTTFVRCGSLFAAVLIVWACEPNESVEEVGAPNELSDVSGCSVTKAVSTLDGLVLKDYDTLAISASPWNKGQNLLHLAGFGGTLPVFATINGSVTDQVLIGSHPRPGYLYCLGDGAIGWTGCANPQSRDEASISPGNSLTPTSCPNNSSI